MKQREKLHSSLKKISNYLLFQCYLFFMHIYHCYYKGRKVTRDHKKKKAWETDGKRIRMLNTKGNNENKSNGKKK